MVGTLAPPPRCPPVCHVWGGHGNQDAKTENREPKWQLFGAQTVVEHMTQSLEIGPVHLYIYKVNGL